MKHDSRRILSHPLPGGDGWVKHVTLAPAICLLYEVSDFVRTMFFIASAIVYSWKL